MIFVKNRRKKIKISLYLIFIMLMQFVFPTRQTVFAGSPQEVPFLLSHDYGGRGTQQEPYESRLWPDASHADYKHRGTSQFKIRLSDGRNNRNLGNKDSG